MKLISVFIGLLCLMGEAGVQPPIQISNNDGTQKFAVATYTYKVVREGLGVQIELPKAYAEKLEDLTKHSVGKRIAISIGKSKAALPVVRDAVKDGRLWVTVTNEQDLNALESALQGN